MYKIVFSELLIIIYIFLVLQNDAMNISLQLASHEQKKADERVLRLVEEHKVY